MAKLSHIIVANPQVETFEGLRELVILVARSGEVFLEFDVKPDYPDTPKNWHMELETAFYWGERSQRIREEMEKDEAGDGDGDGGD